MLWLDVLDFPAVNFYEASFAEHFDAPTQSTTREDGDSLSLYGSGVLPDGSWDQELHAGHQLHLRAHPADRGAHAGGGRRSTSVTVRACITPIRSPAARCCRPWALGSRCSPKGFKGEPYRATDGTIFVCVEGEGKTTVDGKELDWGPNDVFVVPPWKRYSHNVAKEAVLFSISDRPAQKALGIWREGK